MTDDDDDDDSRVGSSTEEARTAWKVADAPRRTARAKEARDRFMVAVLV